VDRYLLPLKDWRNARVKSTGVAPVAVANNTLLKEVARLVPADMEALADVPGIRRWQLADFGEELLDVVQKVTDSRGGSEDEKPARRRRRRKPKAAE
jgi:ribonuclease D